jgi:exodeoxyribonuclease VII small subunit
MDGANLESSVRDFENGMKLIKKAEDILTQAQRKIEIIEQNQNKINS